MKGFINCVFNYIMANLPCHLCSNYCVVIQNWQWLIYLKTLILIFTYGKEFK